MAAPFTNHAHPFGSAGLSAGPDLARAGMYRQGPDSLFVGFHGGRSLWYSGPGGLTLTAGARGGKLKHILA